MFRLYLDEDSQRRALVRSLRAQSINVLTTQEVGMQHANDPAQLGFATEQGRVIYTFNVSDFARLHSVWRQANLHHAGIIVLTDQRTPVGVQVRAILRLMATHSSETMHDRLEFLNVWIRESNPRL